MVHYAVLANPGHNRVYFEQSGGLSLAELEVALGRFSTPCGEIGGKTIAGIPYVTFAAEAPLSPADLARLSRLSFLYALFVEEGREDAPRLLPVALPDTAYLPPEVSRILKYTGKTNELFTRLMINIALNSGAYADEPLPRLLDPVAGRGTTLFEALVWGCSAAGIEIGDKAVGDTAAYFKRFLETEKYKHTFHKERVSGENRSFTAVMHTFALAPSKEDWSGGNTRQLRLVAGNSRYADAFFRKNTFHALVGDLPYGVQHGNVTRENQSSLTRNPRELLTACLPAWRKVLKPGAALVLAWNTLVLPRAEMAALLADQGFEVKAGGPYDRFSHRVDQAIRRDIITAVKK